MAKPDQTIPVHNVSGEDRAIESLGIIVPADATVDLPADAAGRPSKGKPGEEGYDPGEGLLAQPINWAPGKASKVTEGGES